MYPSVCIVSVDSPVTSLCYEPLMKQIYIQPLSHLCVTHLYPAQSHSSSEPPNADPIPAAPRCSPHTPVHLHPPCDLAVSRATHTRRRPVEDQRGERERDRGHHPRATRSVTWHAAGHRNGSKLATQRGAVRRAIHPWRCRKAAPCVRPPDGRGLAVLPGARATGPPTGMLVATGVVVARGAYHICYMMPTATLSLVVW